jgi:hypothetical protein
MVRRGASCASSEKKKKRTNAYKVRLKVKFIDLTEFCIENPLKNCIYMSQTLYRSKFMKDLVNIDITDDGHSQNRAADS